MQAYSDPKRESDPHALPDLEVFKITQTEIASGDWEHNELITDQGWYWWACFPGCLPDSEPVGPFATEAEALADAREGYDDDEV